MKIYTLLAIFLSSLFLLGIVFAATTVTEGVRSVDSLKNIHGIPFYADNEVIAVTEELGHLSLSLKEPALAKELHLTLSFDPRDVQTIAVGARKEAFWLSYDWQEFYQAESFNDEIITETIVIRLSDVLQQPNRSVDLMFKTESTEDIWWDLHSITAEVKWTMPTRWELREYYNRVKSKERPI